LSFWLGWNPAVRFLPSSYEGSYHKNNKRAIILLISRRL
jgi:hypothetical protein